MATQEATRKHLPCSTADRHQFWYMGVLRLFMGLAQIASVIWCTVLLSKNGLSAKTMRAVFIGAGITSLSLLLFKVLGKMK